MEDFNDSIISLRSGSTKNEGRQSEKSHSSTKSHASIEKVHMMDNDEDAISLLAFEEPTEEELLAQKELEKQEKLAQYIAEKCTTIKFMYLSGHLKEVVIHRLLDDYSSIQREIARLHPKSTQIFFCQYIDGSQVRSQTFQMANYYTIREIPVSKKLIYENSTKIHFNKLPTKWDFTNYSGAIQPEIEWETRGLISSIKSKRIGEDESILYLEDKENTTDVDID